MQFSYNLCSGVGSPMNPEAPTFVEYIAMQGEKPPTILLDDGQIHRYGTKKHRWYVLTKESDGFEHGAFGDWSTGQTYNWSNRGAGTSISDVDRLRIEEQRRAIERERKEVQEVARIDAMQYWDQLSDADLGNPYIKKKNLHGTYGARADGDKLVLPVWGDDGHIMSLQTIARDGKKRFWHNARTKGGWYCVGPCDDPNNIRYMAEGFATAASIFEATGKSCIVAFNAGNLKAVKELLEGLPCRIVMDNDESRTGETKGLEADPNAILIPEVGMDANDYANAYGYKALKDLLEPPTEKPYLELFKPKDFIKKPEEGRYIVKHLIPSGPSLVMIYGASGCGKTFVTMDLALSVASGKAEWFGNKIRQSKVLYICGEGVASFKKRATVWCQEHNVGPENIDDMFMFSQTSAPIDDNIVMQKVIESIGAYGYVPPVIIIDTLNRSMAGDENSTKDATKFIVNCSYIQNYFNACVILVHHTGLGENTQDRARGSSAFKGALDSQLFIQRGEDGIISVTQTKNKDEECVPAFYCALEDHEIEDWGYDEDGEPYKGAIVVPVDNKAARGERKKSRNELKFIEIIRKNGSIDDASGMPCISRKTLTDHFQAEYERKNPYDPTSEEKQYNYNHKRDRNVSRYFKEGFVGQLMKEDSGLLVERDGNFVYMEKPDRNGVMPVSVEINARARMKNGTTRRTIWDSMESAPQKEIPKETTLWEETEDIPF